MQRKALSLMVLTAKKSDTLVRYGIRCRDVYFFITLLYFLRYSCSIMQRHEYQHA
jgi:hypothetical protein